MTGVVVLIVVIAVAGAFGLWRARTDGRLRVTSDPGTGYGSEMSVTSGDLGSALGDSATLVQFSSAFCAPCRATRAILAEVAEMVPGVAHVEVDAEANLALVRRLEVRRTPTVLVLDRSGRIRTRAAGAPRKADVIAALGQFL